MKKKLLNEISRVKELMNLISESIVVPYRTLIDDELRIFLQKLQKKVFLGAREKNVIEQLTNPRVFRTLTDDQIGDLISKLAKESEQFRNLMIPRIIKTAQIQKSYVLPVRKTIERYKNVGVDLDDIYDSIEKWYRQQLGDDAFPNLVETLTKQAKRYAYEIYNPTWTSSESFLKAQAELFGKGFQSGYKSKSGGFLALKSVMKAITPQKIEKLFPNYFKRLNTEERRVLWNWLGWGLPDVPSFLRDKKEWGIVGAAGNIAAQLVRKTLYVMGILTALHFIRDLILDPIKPGEEYEGWNIFARTLHRLKRAVEVPPIGVVSPLSWVIELLIRVYVAASTGSDKKIWLALKEYIFGDDEDNIPKVDTETARRLLQQGQNGIDTLTQNLRNELDTLSQGQNSQTLIPDSLLIQNNNSNQADTSATPEKLLDFMKTLPDMKGLGTKDLDFIKDLGNNNWKFDGANDTTYNFKYDPNTKKFTQVGKEKTK